MRNDDTQQRSEGGEDDGRGVNIRLEARPERRLVRPNGSKRHVVYSLAVDAPRDAAKRERRALRLAMVLDRSGSMQGEPIDTAKRTLLSLIEALDERDEAAVVVFDDRIDVLQSAAHVTPQVKQQVRQLLRHVEARAGTALHEGWLTGCRAIAPEAAVADDPRLTRCLLLTDGQANIGEIDSEVIAREAREIRERAGVGTSTLGIGAGYNEALLAPMAVAGGGMFHHIRSNREIAAALGGETGDLRQVAALRVRLEIEAQPGMGAEAISMYPLTAVADKPATWSLDIGDLFAAEERQIVVRFSFPGEDKAFTYAVRGRIVWSDDDGAHQSPWQTVSFTYGSQKACSDEPRDPEAMHWIGLHHAERAEYRAAELSARGDPQAAQEVLRRVRRRIAGYAGEDAQLVVAVQMLSELEEILATRLLSTLESKERYYSSQRRSRGQKDYRGSQP